VNPEFLKNVQTVLEGQLESLEKQLTEAENVWPETMESLNLQVVIRSEMSALQMRISGIEYRLEGRNEEEV
jgi:hypothetical protein